MLITTLLRRSNQCGRCLAARRAVQRQGFASGHLGEPLGGAGNFLLVFGHRDHKALPCSGPCRWLDLEVRDLPCGLVTNISQPIHVVKGVRCELVALIGARLPPGCPEVAEAAAALFRRLTGREEGDVYLVLLQHLGDQVGNAHVPRIKSQVNRLSACASS